jgi:hypothetical protein
MEKVIERPPLSTDVRALVTQLQVVFQQYGYRLNRVAPLDGSEEFTSLALSDGAISSGVYTPTATAVTNVDSATPDEFQWMRVGDVVTVSGRVSVDPTATGATIVRLSLPFASALASGAQCVGAGRVAESAVNESGFVNGDATNDAALFGYTATTTTAKVYCLIFTYRIV